MPNTTRTEAPLRNKRNLLGLLAVSGLTAATARAGQPRAIPVESASMTPPFATLADAAKLALVPVAAATALGDIGRLAGFCDRALDAGLAVGALKEAMVQLYAYAGFPRSLNGLDALMKVVEARRARGLQDAEGPAPGSVPVGRELLEAGTAAQTRLAGAPVRGPLFDFAPAIDRFLKTHLFGDIFARDNLDWQTRELVTVSALAALEGVESQLAAHVRMGMNIGVTADQLRQSADGLASAGYPAAAARLQAVLAPPATAAARQGVSPP